MVAHGLYKGGHHDGIGTRVGYHHVHLDCSRVARQTHVVEILVVVDGQPVPGQRGAGSGNILGHGGQRRSIDLYFQCVRQYPAHHVGLVGAVALQDEKSREASVEGNGRAGIGALVLEFLEVHTLGLVAEKSGIGYRAKLLHAAREGVLAAHNELLEVLSRLKGAVDAIDACQLHHAVLRVVAIQDGPRPYRLQGTAVVAGQPAVVGRGDGEVGVVDHLGLQGGCTCRHNDERNHEFHQLLHCMIRFSCCIDVVVFLLSLKTRRGGKNCAQRSNSRRNCL